MHWPLRRRKRLWTSAIAATLLLLGAIAAVLVHSVSDDNGDEEGVGRLANSNPAALGTHRVGNAIAEQEELFEWAGDLLLRGGASDSSDAIKMHPLSIWDWGKMRPLSMWDWGKMRPLSMWDWGQMHTPQHTVWALAKTAMSKHAETFYSVPRRSNANEGQSVIHLSPPTHFLPLSHLHTHLGNLNMSIIHVLEAMGGMGADAVRMLEAHSNAKSPPRRRKADTALGEKDTKLAAPLQSINITSITAALSCLPTDRLVKIGSKGVLWPKKQHRLLLEGSSPPQLTLPAHRWMVDETLKEAAVIALRSLDGTLKKRKKKKDPSHQQRSKAVVSVATELLYFTYHADSYALGRSRVIQSNMYKDVLGEVFAATKKSRGPRFGPNDEFGVTNWIASQKVPSVGSSVILSHTQYAPSQRSGVDGYVFDILDRIAVNVTAGRKSTAVPLAPVGYFLSHQELAGIITDKGTSTTLRNATHNLTFPFALLSNQSLPPPKGSRIPYGASRQQGLNALVVAYKKWWGIYYVAAGAKSSDAVAVAPSSLPICAPIALVGDLSAVATTNNRYQQVHGKATRGRIDQGAIGTIPFLEFMGPADNSYRQIPIVLEGSMTASNYRGFGGVPSVGGDGGPTTSSDAIFELIASRRNKRAGVLSATKSAHKALPNTTTQPTTVFRGDYTTYRPYLDPASPQYRRILCATYTYHAKVERAAAMHQTTSHLCDKHLIFTDQPVSAKVLERLDKGRFAVMALNTPGGEDYRNMWQKTRMIVDKIRHVMRGQAVRTREEGMNDPDGADTINTIDGRPLTSSSGGPNSGHHAPNADDDVHSFANSVLGKSFVFNFSAFELLRRYAALEEVGTKDQKRADANNTTHALNTAMAGEQRATAITKAINDAIVEVVRIGMLEAPQELFGGGYDYLMLSGDDVSLNVPKLRAYMAEVDELYGVTSMNPPSAFDSIPSTSSTTTPPSASCGDPSYSSRGVHHRAATTPHHFGFHHRFYISGATYVMNRPAYLNWMSGAYPNCQSNDAHSAEDAILDRCHRKQGTISRHASSYGIGEDTFTPHSNNRIVKMTHTVFASKLLRTRRLKAWPRGGAIMSRDSIGYHYCSAAEMDEGIWTFFRERSNVSALVSKNVPKGRSSAGKRVSPPSSA